MRFVAYYRVSTAKQGASGLGLEAQQAACIALARSKGGIIIRAFTEVESGKNNERIELARAMREASITGATLLIAKLDRLSRDAAFLLTLRNSGVKFVAADMPDANDMTVGIMAVVAQGEREAIAARTKAALVAAKARGVRLGNPNGAAALQRAGKGNTAAIRARQVNADAWASNLRETLAELEAQGLSSLPKLAAALTERGAKTASGGTRWFPATVKALKDRLAAS